MARLIFCVFLLLPSFAIAEDIFPPFYARETKKFDDKLYIEKISFRPFYTVYHDIENDPSFEQLQLFWPFVFYQKTKERNFFRFYPFFFYDKRKKEAGHDFDWTLLPFLFYGNDPLEGKYFSFLPFGGLIKGKLGKEKITTVLFPLYVKTEYQKTKTTHLLMPFIQWINGPKKKGRRFWPFAGDYKIYTDESKSKIREHRRFVFWPFWIKQSFFFGEGRTGESLVSFPFYGRYVSNSKKEKMILWPIYKKTEFPKENGVFYTLFWPFLKFGKSDTFERFELWPFYGYKNKVDEKIKYVLWPFIRQETRDQKNSLSKRFWVLPFFWKFQYKDKLSGVERKRVKVWPVLEYKKNEDKVKEVNVLSPFWFNDSKRGGFENNYAPFFSLFHLRYEKKRWYDMKMLFHLVQFSKTEDNRKIKLFPFIFKYERFPEQKKVSFLGGLLEYQRKGKRKRFKFLWIPFGRSIK